MVLEPASAILWSRGPGPVRRDVEKVQPSESGRTFRADYPECACLLLYRGSERRRIGNVLCLPVEEFLRGLHPARGLTS